MLRFEAPQRRENAALANFPYISLPLLLEKLLHLSPFSPCKYFSCINVNGRGNGGSNGQSNKDGSCDGGNCENK